VVRRFHQLVKHAVMIVVESNKAEWLRDHFPAAADRLQHFSHALHVAGLGFKGKLDEIAFRERFRYLQQTSRGGEGLQLGLGALSVT